jgi:hypothetical protein
MKLTLLFLLLSCCSSPNRPVKRALQYEKRWNYGKVTVVTGFDAQKPVIKIFQSGAQVFIKKGGDAAYGEVDTLDINKDGMLDFVFESRFEDGSTVGMLVSVKRKHTYKIYNIVGDILNKYDCSTAPYDQGDPRLKSFVLVDIDKNGKRDIVTMAIRNKEGVIESTGCSKNILYEELEKAIVSASPTSLRKATKH